MSPHLLPRGPRIIRPLATGRDTACLLHPLDSFRFHRHLNLHHVLRVLWPLMDRNHQAWGCRRQMQASLCLDILPPRLAHLLRRASHQVHQSLQLPHSRLYQRPLVLLCQQVFHNNLNPCISRKQDTIPLSQHHLRRIFLHRIYQRCPFLHNQCHPRVSHSQFLARCTNTPLPLLLLCHRSLPEWFRTTSQGRDHCLPNLSKPHNEFHPLPRYL